MFLYRLALRLCPSSFRRAYADDMIRDFADAHADAASGGAGPLWRLRVAMAVDAVRTIIVQWSRTGVPVIAAIAATAALIPAGALATLARRVQVDIPTDQPERELIGVLLLTATTVCVIAMTIVFTLWGARPVRRRRRWG